MNIAGWLNSTALSKPNAIAMFYGTDEYCTYNELLVRVQYLSAIMHTQYHIQKGDRVAIFLKNHPVYLEILYTVWWLGAVVVPINYKLHPNEVTWILENSSASLLFTEADIFNKPKDCQQILFAEHKWQNFLDSFFDDYLEKSDGFSKDFTTPHKIDANDLAWIFYTSGTTGRPKGAMLTHKNLTATALAYTMDVDHADASFNMLYAAPMSHGAGLYNHIFVRSGATHVIPRSRAFEPSEIESLAKHFTKLSAERFDNLVFFAAPTMIKRLIQHAKQVGWHGEGIRSIVYGGGPMYGNDIDEALSQFGNRFIQIYGQGETPMTITSLRRELVADDSHPQWRTRRDSVGQAMCGIQIKIVDDMLQEKATNEAGEILVQGDSVMQGYWQNDLATQKSLQDGWLHTGDIGILDQDGFLTLTSRSKDVIISGGSNIYPREVEEVLLRHSQVKEASVVGKPHAEWGEIVVAFVVLKKENDTLNKISLENTEPENTDSQNIELENSVKTNEDKKTEADLEKWCKANIASFKKPKRYIFLKTLPKNSYGKILKTELREML